MLAWGSTADAAPPEVSVDAEAGLTQSLERAGATSSATVGLGATVRWEGGVELQGGARRLLSPYLEPWPALEGYAAARVSPPFGAWRPAVGLELGLTSAFDRDWSEAAVDGPNLLTRADAHTSPVYTAVQLEPLRASWRRVTGGVLELAVGTTWPDWGRVFRFEVTAARVGVTL